MIEEEGLTDVQVTKVEVRKSQQSEREDWDWDLGENNDRPLANEYKHLTRSIEEERPQPSPPRKPKVEQKMDTLDEDWDWAIDQEEAPDRIDPKIEALKKKAKKKKKEHEKVVADNWDWVEDENMHDLLGSTRNVQSRRGKRERKAAANQSLDWD